MSSEIRYRLRWLITSIAGFPVWLGLAVTVNRIVGTVSNVDFVVSARGNSRMAAIWNWLITPAGNTTLLLVALLCIAAFLFWPKSEGSLLVWRFDRTQLGELRRQIESLTGYEKLAVSRLTINEGMTGSQFETYINEFGFPILTLQQQHAIEATFDRLSERVAFLHHNPATNQWSVKGELLPQIRYLLSLGRQARAGSVSV